LITSLIPSLSSMPDSTPISLITIGDQNIV
jgi:hypothetical protein